VSGRPRCTSSTAPLPEQILVVHARPPIRNPPGRRAGRPIRAIAPPRPRQNKPRRALMLVSNAILAHTEQGHRFAPPGPAPATETTARVGLPGPARPETKTEVVAGVRGKIRGSGALLISTSTWTGARCATEAVVVSAEGRRGAVRTALAEWGRTPEALPDGARDVIGTVPSPLFGVRSGSGAPPPRHPQTIGHQP
jgi:hypothetical protein